MLSVLIQFFCDAVKESIGILGGIILLLSDHVSSEDVLWHAWGLGAVPSH